MIKVLFICHGNICRSPMAEFVLKDMVKKAGIESDFYIESAATSTEEIRNGIGNPVYPPARKKLAEHGITCEGKHARQTIKKDYDKFDYIIAMDRNNLRNMAHIYREENGQKIHLLKDFTDNPGDVADPWYTGDFDATWRDVNEGCKGFLEWLGYTFDI